MLMQSLVFEGYPVKRSGQCEGFRPVFEDARAGRTGDRRIVDKI